MTDQTVFYAVADVLVPSPEPFMVLRIDTTVRMGNGCAGLVHSLHHTREEAEREVHKLSGGKVS